MLSVHKCTLFISIVFSIAFLTVSTNFANILAAVSSSRGIDISFEGVTLVFEVKDLS